MLTLLRVLFCYLIVQNNVICYNNNGLREVFSWKQISYDIGGVKYVQDTANEKKPHAVFFDQELDDNEKFFIQYNNIPIGMEVYEDTVFITVPRRRFGIPSTLNSVSRSSKSPPLRPYPDSSCLRDLVSVYRPRVDSCGRLWVVDTGLMEVPDARRQVQPPSIVIFDLKTRKRILKYELKPSDLVNNRTSGGLTSIAVEVDAASCDDAYAYINDLATGTMVVFSLKQMDSWTYDHSSFKYDETALNFSVAGNVISWMDNLFSIAITDPDSNGRRKAFYHPLVSLEEFSIYTDQLKNKDGEKNFKREGKRGMDTQSGSHAYHGETKTLIFANVAQDAILCWNVDKPLIRDNVAIIAQDSEKLVYISDLKIYKDEVWVLANQIPNFVFSTLNPNEYNFYVHKGSIKSLIKGTVCESA